LGARVQMFREMGRPLPGEASSFISFELEFATKIKSPSSKPLICIYKAREDMVLLLLTYIAPLELWFSMSKELL
jgi:hypothetical protein